MSDPVTTSKTAREGLARGLNALQADPSVPSHLVELAAPIAQAMGALHQLERTNQLAPHADVALTHVRGALAQLQAAGTSHPAVVTATDAVAQSLSLVHTLSRMANGPAASPAAPPVAAAHHAPAPQPAAIINPVRSGTAGMPAKAPVAPAGGPHPLGGTVGMSPPAHGGPGFPPPGAPGGSAGVNPLAPTAVQGFNSGGMVARDPFAAPPPAGGGGPPPMGANVPFGAPPPGAPGGKPASPSMPVPAPPAQGNMQLIAADLGAHSPTNFYKGLSGNDIIDHGGLFVSTYVPPKIGTPVRLRVSLPGGYEFEANAVVKWTREQGDDASPGFGAQFTAITPEARQLVYRYVRNREPLFHDDL